MQKIESDDAIHLFCVGSAEPAKDELVLDADGGSITFTSADGTAHTYQSGEKLDTDILEAAVSCKIDSGINLFSYENAFYFHKSEGLPTVAIQLKRGSLEDISEEKGLWSNAGYSVWDKEGNRLSDSDCEVKVHGNTWK